MSERIRFHCDEHIHPAIVAALRRRSIDVTTAADAGLLGAIDEKHLEFARAHKRVLITKDSDFMRFHASGEPHFGIAYCKQGSRTIGQMLASLINLYEDKTADEVIGLAVYL